MFNFFDQIYKEEFICECWRNYILGESPKQQCVKSRTTVSVIDSWTTYFGEESITEGYGLAKFKRFTIPLVRRIYPQLIADNIINVQPMAEPAALVYYLREKYVMNE